MFAWGRQLELLDWLCVAMLETVRHLILGKDFSNCMQTLFSYPQVSDPKIQGAGQQTLGGKIPRSGIKAGFSSADGNTSAESVDGASSRMKNNHNNKSVAGSRGANGQPSDEPSEGGRGQSFARSFGA